MLSLLLLSIIFTLWGSIITSYEFEIEGLAGLAQDLGKPGSSVTQYSLLNTFNHITSQAPAGDALGTFGIWFIAVLYISFSFVVPVSQLIMLTILWIVPMRLRTQKYFFFFNEIVSAWAAMEVFIISIMVALLEIGQISGFMVGDNCNPLQPFFDAGVELGILSPNDAQCFFVRAKMGLGCYWLLLASVFSNISCQFVTRAAEAAIEDRENRVKGRKPRDEFKAGCGKNFLQCIHNGMAICEFPDA